MSSLSAELSLRQRGALARLPLTTCQHGPLVRPTLLAMRHWKQAANLGGARGDGSIEREESNEIALFCTLFYYCVHTFLIICLHTLKYVH